MTSGRCWIRTERASTAGISCRAITPRDRLLADPRDAEEHRFVWSQAHLRNRRFRHCHPLMSKGTSLGLRPLALGGLE